MRLKDLHAHWERIQALESRFRVDECSFNSIFGTFEGHRIFASRKVAEKIEKPTPLTDDSKVSDRTNDKEPVCYLPGVPHLFIMN
jgi:hypothetical protein